MNDNRPEGSSERREETAQGFSHRDVAAFDARSADYDTGWLGRMHHGIADRAADLAAEIVASPSEVLDIGCGTGYLVGQLAARFPHARLLAGVDPAPGMIAVAGSITPDPRAAFTVGTAEQLPYDDASFDLLVSTTSFDHWHDQLAGLRECARVARPGGRLLLCDLFSVWLLPTLSGARRNKARTKARASRLLTTAGFGLPRWHGSYLAVFETVTTTKP